MTMPINTRGQVVRSVNFYRCEARKLGARTWKGALDRLAMRDGKAIAHLANDGAIIAIAESGKVKRWHFGPSEIAWHSN